MQGPTTVITNPKDPEIQTTFTFDESFWSHDGFTTDDLDTIAHLLEASTLTRIMFSTSSESGCWTMHGKGFTAASLLMGKLVLEKVTP